MSRLRTYLLLITGALVAVLLGWLAMSRRRVQPVTMPVVPVTVDPAAPVMHTAAKTYNVWWVNLLIIPGMILLALVVSQSFEPERLSKTHQQFVLLVAGIGLMAVGLTGERPHLPTWSRRAALPLLGIIGLAVVLRVWSLDGLLRFFVDETLFSNGIIDMLHGGYTQPILGRFDEVAAFTRLYPYLESLTVGIFGRNLVGFRLVSALLGTLTIPALYFLACTLYGRSTALLAALLLATFPPHIHYSRLALNNVADPLFGTLALAFLARGFRDNRRPDYALAGIMLGLTQYFYEGGRLLYPVLVAGWLLIHVRQSRRSNEPVYWWHVIVLAIGALAVALPMYIVIWGDGLGMAPRLAMKGFTIQYYADMVSSLENMLWHIQHVLKSFAIYAFLPDQSLYYSGQTALVLPCLVPFLLIGLWQMLRRGPRVLLLCLLGASVGNSLLFFSPWSTGFVVTFPLLMLLVALGLRQTALYVFQSWAHRYNIRITRYFATLLALLIATVQIVYYFGPHLTYFNKVSRVHHDSQDAAFRAAEFPSATQVHVIAVPLDYHFFATEIMQFLRDDVVMDVVEPAGFDVAYLEQLSRFVDHAFFVTPDDEASLMRLRDYFNVRGPFESPYPLPPDRAFLLYYAQATN